MTNTPTVLTEAQIGEIEARDAEASDDMRSLCADRRALLRHIRSSRPPAVDWQPIETAPRRSIIVCGGTFTHDSGNYPEWPLEGSVRVYPGHRGSWVTSAGHGEYVYSPTMWRPLPSADVRQGPDGKPLPPAPQARKDGV